MPFSTNPRSDTTRPSRRRRVIALSAAGALALTAVAGMSAAQAAHTVSLTGSNFEIDVNANLTVEHAAPSIDWKTVNEVRQPDKASGAGDDSFGQGSKEDTPVPSVVSGSIPPNKSDLLNFGFHLEKATAGDFLHLFWHRVQEPSGTTNMDFEFNQSTTISGNGVTPVRTAGDVLIQYDLSQGGTSPTLWLSRWITPEVPLTGVCEAANSLPCWEERDSLTAAGDATGSINTTAIAAADADGLGDISARTFGEATVDFDAISGGGCTPFGSAYLKSRSSDSFTAAMKDFIKPVATNINNCGALKIVKTKKHAAANPSTQPHAGVEFTVTGPTHPNGTKVTTATNGTYCLGGLEPGSYTVKETVPQFYAVTSNDTQTATVIASKNDCSDISAGATVTFTNVPLTDITVKVNSQVDGGTFSSVDCEPTATDPDVPRPTSGTGDVEVTVPNLRPGIYVCTIDIDP